MKNIFLIIHHHAIDLIGLRFVVALLVTTFGFSFCAYGDYLDELSIEAESTSSVPAKGKQATTPSLERDKMERLLRGSRPSIYLFYSRLGSGDKMQIFKDYIADKSTSSNRLSHLQKNVLDHYLK